MGRYSPTVTPFVGRDVFSAGAEGLERGFGIGTEIAERQRRRKLEDRQEARADEYLGMQREYADSARMARAIDQARAGYSDFEGDPNDPDVVDVPGQYGHIDYRRSAEGAQHRAQENSYKARTEEQRKYAEDQARRLQDAIDANDESYILSHSPETANAMRDRAPVPGSDAWKAMKKFETDEDIRRDRARPRSTSTSTNNPRVSQLSAMIDDERARNTNIQARVRNLKPGMVVMSPADTAGYGQAQRDLSASDSTLTDLTTRRREATGLWGSEGAPAPAQDQGGTNIIMTDARRRMQDAITRVARDPRIPPAQKLKAYDEILARWRTIDPTAGQVRRP